MKAIVVDNNLDIIHHVNVDFDKELKEFRTKGGVCRESDTSNVVTVPVLMWLKALDMCLDKLKLDGLNFQTVVALSGSAQQHGSVWWKNGSSELLGNLNYDDFLHKQLVSAFSLTNSPIWMDSSTTEECNMIQDHVGGPQELAEITGSRAYERFTGPQIAKIYKKKPEVFHATERISLISNFLASVFLGKYAPFDVSDASGMNMLDIKSKSWSEKCLQAVVEGDISSVELLRKKLGSIIANSSSVLGKVSDYFIECHGFSSNCLVSSFTGDNPASMAGLCIDHGELFISLGTSDTAVFPLDKPSVTLNGHVLCNPIDDNSYIGMICFKNGARTRQRIRNKCAKSDWDQFSKLLDSTTRGNFGNIGFYFDMLEIYPLCEGDFRFNQLDQKVSSFSDEIEVRALIEGQVMRLCYHTKLMGLDIDNLNKILITGGASENKQILQVISDVFKKPVYTLSVPNSACLGAAYLAKYATYKYLNADNTNDEPIKSFIEYINGAMNNNDIAKTKSNAEDRQDVICNSRCLAVEYVEENKSYSSSNVYQKLLERYIKLEKTLC